MKLSLCMIVKNEAATLPKCLNSVKGVVDEMIILDTGSSDRTPDIAQEFGAKVYHFQWCNDFSAARNAALKYVTGDWILVLDADETLSPSIVPQIRSAIESEEYLLINLVRQEVGAEQSPYSLVSRLFRNHPHIQFQRPYHALVDDSVSAIFTQETHWQIGYLQGIGILHKGYQKMAIAQNNKYAKAQTTMEAFLATHPDDPYVCSKLGALYVQTGKVTQGLKLLQKGFNQANFQHQGITPVEQNYEILYELHYHLGIAHSHLQDTQEAIAHYQAAIKLPIYPLLKLGAYNNLGNLLKASGDINGAKIAYETTLKIDPSFVMGHYNLGMIFKALGLFTDAIACYQKAIRCNPNYAPAYQNLGVVQLKVGNVPASLTAFQNAILLYEQQNPEEAKRLRQGLQEMGFLKS
ncbi:TPR domain-containing glycosyltransferase [Nodularia spumigena]|uniref:TPR domain-containing glycosyltransferase n=2 Tax=Cyanophyceae TaxID=3028117 RepID=UPI00232E6C32|nr:TPR domain-containing glycosyltransferase [Nodularia spumigena]MDB9356515.1 tetratricopeptide repeat protein [Nodularia spumigena CS-587/03]MDB9303731.1 tetratricopeptide repeat protein [Nodularia spumigena CS-591/12]MDB9341809.1 tetratricopeptide repeat protein [Nodularia spumigena CS-589/07]MDB9342576.1 tetratricopeptide repeat protein [Nodularia spumigena CS-588/06]MDB9367950.1 tetratricopeptide repeat protein [Nodularia spumigena CS-586/05]